MRCRSVTCANIGLIHLFFVNFFLTGIEVHLYMYWLLLLSADKDFELCFPVRDIFIMICILVESKVRCLKRLTLHYHVHHNTEINSHHYTVQCYLLMFNISITVHFPIIKHKYRISILILMKTERRSILFYIWATNIYLLYTFLKGLCLQFEILFSNETLVYMLKSYNYINTTGTTSGTGTVPLPEHLISTSVFSGVRVTRTLVLCVVFCRSLFVLFYFGHCVVCTSSRYGFILHR